MLIEISYKLYELKIILKDISPEIKKKVFTMNNSFYLNLKIY